MLGRTTNGAATVATVVGLGAVTATVLGAAVVGAEVVVGAWVADELEFELQAANEATAS
jgi:hypothetical protein